MMIFLEKPEGISESLWNGLNDCGKLHVMEAAEQVKQDSERKALGAGRVS